MFKNKQCCKFFSLTLLFLSAACNTSVCFGTQFEPIKSHTTVNALENQLNFEMEIAKSILKKQGFIVKISDPALIIGDLHGDIESTQKIIETATEYITNGSIKSVVFLGDYVDRGHDSLNVISALIHFKNTYPKEVFLLRGNHEDASINTYNGFQKECIKKGYPNLFLSYNELFNYFPIVAIINSESSLPTMCVHGGMIPPENWDQFKNILEGDDFFYESIYLYNDPVRLNLTWSDPGETYMKKNKMRNNFGCVFDKTSLDNFLAHFGFARLIRGHQAPLFGYKDEFNNGKCYTVFSCKNSGIDIGHPSMLLLNGDEVIAIPV